MSTRRKPDLSGPSKKISSWVRPGVCEVRASALRPVSALMRLDLPTLDRPATAISMSFIAGSDASELAAVTNCAIRRRRDPALSLAPAASGLLLLLAPPGGAVRLPALVGVLRGLVPL